MIPDSWITHIDFEPDGNIGEVEVTFLNGEKKTYITGTSDYYIVINRLQEQMTRTNNDEKLFDS